MGILKALVIAALSLGISITSVLAADTNCTDIDNGANAPRNIPNLNPSDPSAPQQGRGNGETAADARHPTSVTPTAPAAVPVPE